MKHENIYQIHFILDILILSFSEIIIIIIIIIITHVECKNKSNTSNNMGDWDYFKVIQKIREQHTTKT